MWYDETETIEQAIARMLKDSKSNKMGLTAFHGGDLCGSFEQEAVEAIEAYVTIDSLFKYGDENSATTAYIRTLARGHGYLIGYGVTTAANEVLCGYGHQYRKSLAEERLCSVTNSMIDEIAMEINNYLQQVFAVPIDDQDSILWDAGYFITKDILQRKMATLMERRIAESCVSVFGAQPLAAACPARG